MIGNYRVDDPSVVWLGSWESFKKVVRGWAIHDRKIFSGEIYVEKENGESVGIHLPENADFVKEFEGKAFADVLEEIESCL